MRPAFYSARALELLAERAEGRVELQRHRTRAETQRRHLRSEMALKAASLADLEDLIRGIDRVLGGPTSPIRRRGATPGQLL